MGYNAFLKSIAGLAHLAAGTVDGIYGIHFLRVIVLVCRTAEADIIQMNALYAPLLDVAGCIGADTLEYFFLESLFLIVDGTYPVAVIESLQPGVDGYAQFIANGDEALGKRLVGRIIESGIIEQKMIVSLGFQLLELGAVVGDQVAHMRSPGPYCGGLCLGEVEEFVDLAFAGICNAAPLSAGIGKPLIAGKIAERRVSILVLVAVCDGILVRAHNKGERRGGRNTGHKGFVGGREHFALTGSECTRKVGNLLPLEILVGYEEPEAVQITRLIGSIANFHPGVKILILLVSGNLVEHQALVLRVNLALTRVGAVGITTRHSQQQGKRTDRFKTIHSFLF